MIDAPVQTPHVDLDSYFARIGYDGPRTATLEAVQAIILHHTQTIPFENLNPFFRLPVRLDLDSLQTKLVHSRRGGFCFEQNSLLRAMLLALGFESRALGARVIWNRQPGEIPARTHMLQLLTIDGQPYIADVGFGGMTPTSALRLVPNIEQATPHEAFRLIEEDQEFVLEAMIGENWRALYRFDLVAQHPVDYEVSNFYVCHHPTSHFISGISAARVEPGRRYALRDNKFSIHRTGGISEEQILTSVAELRTLLDEIFDIAVPTEVDTDAAMQSLIEPVPVSHR